MPEFTDHGLSHLCSLIERISSWTIKSGDYLTDKLATDDALKLLIATLIHDLGMLSQRAKDLPDDAPYGKRRATNPDLATWVRRTHVDRLQKLFESTVKELWNSSEVNKDQKKIFATVIAIAGAHEKWAWDFAGIKLFWNNTELQDHIDSNDKFLARIVAVSDLLDEDGARCDTATLIQHRHGDELNKAHWLRHCLTDGRIVVHDGKVYIKMKKPADWSNNTSRLRPVFSALRNHFKLIMLYDSVSRYKDLNENYVDASLSIDFNPEPALPANPYSGIPKEESEILKDWKKIDGFGTEEAFCFQLLNSFMAEALNIITPEQQQFFSPLQLETVDLSIFDEIKGNTPRYLIEKTFCGLLKGPCENSAPIAYKYLQDIAQESHLTGDMNQVLYLCRIAIENLPDENKEKFRTQRTQSDKIELSNDLCFDDWHWAFSLLFCWYSYSLDREYFELSKISSKDNRLDNFKRFIGSFVDLATSSDINSWLEKTNSFFTDFDNFGFDQKNEKYHEEDIPLLCYSSELIFVKCDMDKNKWAEYHKKLQEYHWKDEFIKRRLDNLYNRLCWQSKIFFNTPINGFSYKTVQDELKLAKGFEYLYDLDKKSLGKFLEKYTANISIDSPEYIPFAQLWEQYNYLWSDPDEKNQSPTAPYLRLIERSRYFWALQKSLSGIVLNEFKRDIDSEIEPEKLKDLATKQIILSRTLPVNINNMQDAINHSNLTYYNSELGQIFHQMCMFMVFSLRSWSLYHFRTTCSYLSTYYSYMSSPDLAIFYWLKSDKEIDKENNTLRNLAFSFDRLNASRREAFFKYVLNSPNIEAFRAHKLIELLADAIPEKLLPQFAKWTGQLEKKEIKTSGCRNTFLDFWGNIFEYAAPPSELLQLAIKQLSEVIFNWLNNGHLPHDWKFFLYFIICADAKTALAMIDNLKGRTFSSKSSTNSARWSIIYNACKNRPELLNDNTEWLSQNSKDDSSCELWTSTTLAKYNNSPKVMENLHAAQKRLQSEIIEKATAALEDIKNGKKSRKELTGARNVTFVTWEEDATITHFIDRLVEAYQCRYANTEEKWEILHFLSNMLDHCTVEARNSIFAKSETLLNQHNEDNDLLDDKYKLLSAKINLAYCLVRSGAVPVRKIRTIQNQTLSITGIENTVYLDALFAMYIYFSLTAKSKSLEYMSFFSKAQTLILLVEAKMSNEVDANSSGTNHTGQLVAIIQQMTKFISSKKAPIFANNVITSTHKDDILSFFKEILEKFGCHVNPDIRAAVAYVLTHGENSGTLDDESLKDMLVNLRQDPRLRVQFAARKIADQAQND